MEVLIRVVLGLILLPIALWLTFFVVNLVTALINGAAILLAKAVRGLFGVKGTWVNGTAFAVVVGTIAKWLVILLMSLSVFVWVVIPGAEDVGAWMASAAALVFLCGWMPATFTANLLSSIEDYTQISAEIEGRRYY